MSAPLDANEPAIRQARANDLTAVRSLLTECCLPSADLTGASLDSFLVATRNEEIVGVAGLQRSGDFALFRSVAVRTCERNTGLGKRLVEGSLALAQALRCKALYMIPNDASASRYFQLWNFKRIERRHVPPDILQLPEFTHLCPQTHPCFRKVLDPSFVTEIPMKKLDVFDPAMCCSTGVCGVDVDPVLVQFAADMKWLDEQGFTVTRYNLGQEPQAFVDNPGVVREMEGGMDRLPILVVDGHIVSTGIYPSRQQLAQKLGLALTSAEKPPVKAGGCGCKPGSC